MQVETTQGEVAQEDASLLDQWTKPDGLTAVIALLALIAAFLADRRSQRASDDQKAMAKRIADDQASVAKRIADEQIKAAEKRWRQERLVTQVAPAAALAKAKLRQLSTDLNKSPAPMTTETIAQLRSLINETEESLAVSRDVGAHRLRPDLEKMERRVLHRCRDTVQSIEILVSRRSSAEEIPSERRGALRPETRVLIEKIVDDQTACIGLLSDLDRALGSLSTIAIADRKPRS